MWWRVLSQQAASQFQFADTAVRYLRAIEVVAAMRQADPLSCTVAVNTGWHSLLIVIQDLQPAGRGASALPIGGPSIAHV